MPATGTMQAATHQIEAAACKTIIRAGTGKDKMLLQNNSRKGQHRNETVAAVVEEAAAADEREDRSQERSISAYFFSC
jgi:hypothetical protein